MCDYEHSLESQSWLLGILGDLKADPSSRFIAQPHVWFIPEDDVRVLSSLGAADSHGDRRATDSTSALAALISEDEGILDESTGTELHGDGHTLDLGVGLAALDADDPSEQALATSIVPEDHRE
jgi:hypothetical protein